MYLRANFKPDFRFSIKKKENFLKRVKIPPIIDKNNQNTPV